ncbi:uncharacterized protein LOC126836063 isoform X2 [Adelges cooleyi]|uniref:uncharacterized protein LOC126836063 isoform X2 n=1 Tax=Adelges cooleyi TaxID=133065 RepID=UPI00217F6EA1|nr:uncharacterized protein LOC126836063 isoform X2 [Adelges cooleyi]
MKFFRILLSLSFVYVLADITAYKSLLAITNGLEHVIKTMVYENRFTLVKMNFMIAIPEYAILTDDNRIEIINHQLDMRQMIIRELPIPVPNTPDQKYMNINLHNMGEARRKITRKALKQIIMDELNRKQPVFYFSQMCCFIGLWMSTQTPSLYTRTTQAGFKNVCTITDRADHVIKYRSLNGIICQVDVNNIDEIIIELKVQILEEQLH